MRLFSLAVKSLTCECKRGTSASYLPRRVLYFCSNSSATSVGDVSAGSASTGSSATSASTGTSASVSSGFTSETLGSFAFFFFSCLRRFSSSQNEGLALLALS